MAIQLGKMKEVPLREIWKHEQYDFSEWLSKEQNLSELSEVLNLNLIDAQTEQYVGIYRCDILCKDELTGKSVLIENQLEPSNHDHLGKIITYASGLDAAVVIWIVEKANEEHASAIEWLNKHIDSSVQFFLLEIHAVKIGDSLPAPMFKIIEQPNDFNQQVKSTNKEGMNKSEEKRFEFWSLFNEKLISKGKPFNTRKVTPDHWYNFAIGSSSCQLQMDLVNRDGFIRISTIVYNSKEQYENFLNNKETIEKEIGCKLFWPTYDEEKSSNGISYKIEGLDFDNQNNYDLLINEAIDKLVLFKKAFKKYLIK